MLADSVFIQIMISNVISGQIAVVAFALGRAGYLPEIGESRQRGFDFPSSIRKPRSLICASLRPKNSIAPSGR